MKRHIHLSACLLCTSMVLAHPPRITLPEEAPVETRQEEQNNTDEKTGRIVASIGHLFEGVIGLIKDIKSHEKANIISGVGKLVNGIMNVAATATTKGNPSEEDIAHLRALVNEATRRMLPQLQQRARCEAHDLQAYLVKTPFEELEATLRYREEAVEQEEASEQDVEAVELNEDEQELSSGILNSLYEMVHDLFAIIQDPDNPQIVGQSIADMLSSIMNIASQALKYEYLHAKEDDNRVAFYLESFSTELTKEIRQLMLQTALNLRKGCHSSSCCKPSCCKPCCKPSSCCPSSCNSCCRSPEAPVEVQPKDRQLDDAEVTRSSCCSCNKPCNSCSSCSKYSSCCGCHKAAPLDEQPMQVKAQPEQPEVTRASCCSSCSGKSSCNCGCNSCGCCGKKSEEIIDAEKLAAQDEATEETKACSNCGCQKPCGCGCKNEEVATAEQEAQEEATKGCGCGKPKPQTTVDRLKDDVTKTPSKCGCTGSNQPPRPKHHPKVKRIAARLVYPEGYEEAHASRP